ncbi:MAG TPA: xanthine dehydrogenase family protein molybdopterin-binding subunit [Chitinophagaceae bacterium]|nr:xanthine dehydrogenase family protein molybdopterin-binding subunit [Chitinophagaceae bacterium]
MNETNSFSRRNFIKTGATLGGGLLLSFHIPAFGKGLRAGFTPAPVDFAPNAFIRIGADDMVTIICNHSEMGQGAYTSIPMMIAEELDADWSKVKFESAPVDPAYNHAQWGMQATGGSTTTLAEYDRLRKAGASGRAMLIAAAAQTWAVDPSSCRTEKGKVIHGSSGRSLRYSELVAAAAAIKPPADVKLKDPSEFTIIGKPTKRLDTAEKSNGTGVFGIDVKLPGLLTALVARPPVFGAKLKSFNADKARAIPGVKHVTEIERGVAVVADGFWPAKLGREALVIEWEEGPLAGLNSAAQRKSYAELAKQTGVSAKKEGDVEAAKAKAVKKIEAVYELPYLAHAPMEPLNCVADVRPDSCDIWVGTQFQTMDFMNAVQITGLKPEQVKLHTTLLGGGFGRRAVMDSHFVREAVQVSKAVKAPVKVVWTREDDIRGGYYRPAAHHVLKGGIDATGKPAYWEQQVVCQSFVMGTPMEGMMVKDGLDHAAVEGAADLSYAIPNLKVGWNMAPGGVPTLWWRSVGHSHTAFATESFIDELARAAGKDPLAYRLQLLEKHPRLKNVLEIAAAKAGWGKTLGTGRAMGIAAHESFGSFVADVAEVSVAKDGRIKVHKVVCVIDCGPTVNPETVHAQMESCVAFGLSAALFGEISFEKGRVKQGNFNDYQILRMNEMPKVEVHIVPSTDSMGGVGEPGVPPVAPALANAIFAATGKRIRRLPIRPADLVKKA